MSYKFIAYYCLIGFFCFSTFFVSAQDQRVADSLTLIYQENKLEGIEKLELLNKLSFHELNNQQLSLKYAEELIALAKLTNNNKYLHSGYLQKGATFKIKGNTELALNAFFKSVDAAKKANYIIGEGTGYMSIADVYSIMNNFNNAENYYKKAISLLRESNDPIRLASAL